MICVCIGVMTYAQNGKSFGIGVDIPDPSTVFHIQSRDHGILIPNVKIVNVDSKEPISAEIKESLLVYNTGSETVEKGYYYWTTTTTQNKGKWVKVLTTEDYDILSRNQIKESFVESMVEENGVAKGTGVFIYTPDQNEADNEAAEGRVVMDIPSLVKEHQTVTSFNLVPFDLYHYSNGDVTRVLKSKEESESIGVFLEKKTKELELVFSDERGEQTRISTKELLGEGIDDLQAITALKIDGSGTGLVYTNDKAEETILDLKELVQKSETPTFLTMDENDNLIFINERGIKQQISIRGAVKEPWHVAETNTEATSIDENIFTNGWVGVGLNAVDAQKAIGNLKPDEKLRVNGSIYARNSYYADYVFENYYTKEASSINESYRFKDLNTVESYIKNNHHLPGITPINELEKSTEDGYLINVSELSIQLLEKVEELYLHTIEQQNRIEAQAKIMESQNSEIQDLKMQFRELFEYVKGKEKK